jgi:hypothetical protein
MDTQGQFSNALLHKDVLKAGPSSNILNAKQEKANQEDCELIQMKLAAESIKSTAQLQNWGNEISLTGRFTVQDIVGAICSAFHTSDSGEYVQYELDSVW